MAFGMFLFYDFTGKDDKQCNTAKVSKLFEQNIQAEKSELCIREIKKKKIENIKKRAR